MKHIVILIAMAIVMTLAACSDNKIVYRGDGDKPQTSYEATLSNTKTGVRSNTSIATKR